jgi:heme oxygenase
VTAASILRDRTRDEHEAIERALDLGHMTATRAAYQKILERFYGFYLPFETAVTALSCVPSELEGSQRSEWLAQDLRALGGDPSSLRLCTTISMRDDRSDALGCLYVLEGASLGGQLISREVRAKLGILRDTGGKFFHGRGDAASQSWKRFGSILAADLITPEEQERAVEGALRTFRTLRVWCEPS